MEQDRCFYCNSKESIKRYKVGTNPYDLKEVIVCDLCRSEEEI